MTTENIVNPIIPNVVRKQYRRGMSLSELCRLYETAETTIRPIIEGIKQERTGRKEKSSSKKKGLRYDYLVLAAKIEERINAGMNLDTLLYAGNISRKTYYNVKDQHGAHWKMKPGRPSAKANQKGEPS